MTNEQIAKEAAQKIAKKFYTPGWPVGLAQRETFASEILAVLNAHEPDAIRAAKVQAMERALEIAQRAYPLKNLQQEITRLKNESPENSVRCADTAIMGAEEPAAHVGQAIPQCPIGEIKRGDIQHLWYSIRAILEDAIRWDVKESDGAYWEYPENELQHIAEYVQRLLNNLLADSIKALQKIANEYEGCHCKHDTGDCCLKIGEPCPHCTAEVTLAMQPKPTALEGREEAHTEPATSGLSATGASNASVGQDAELASRMTLDRAIQISKEVVQTHSTCSRQCLATSTAVAVWDEIDDIAPSEKCGKPAAANSIGVEPQACWMLKDAVCVERSKCNALGCQGVAEDWRHAAPAEAQEKPKSCHSCGGTQFEVASHWRCVNPDCQAKNSGSWGAEAQESAEEFVPHFTVPCDFPPEPKTATEWQRLELEQRNTQEVKTATGAMAFISNHYWPESDIPHCEHCNQAVGWVLQLAIIWAMRQRTESLRAELAQAVLVRDSNANVAKDLEARAEKAESDLAEARKERDHFAEQNLAWANSLEKSQSNLTAARAALEKYGDHLKSCNIVAEGNRTCTCGYTQAKEQITLDTKASNVG